MASDEQELSGADGASGDDQALKATSDDADAHGEKATDADVDGDADAIFVPAEIPVRILLAIGLPVLAAAIMVGGIFTGIAPRVIGGLAGLAGVGVGVLASRVQRPGAAYAIIGGLLLVIGPLMLLPDVGAIGQTADLISEAREQASLFTPPVAFLDGWKVMTGWTMALIGFSAAWLGLVAGFRSMALLLPLPVAAIAGISVPDDAQVVSGIVVLILFAIALGLLSSEQSVDDEDERPSLAYELRKMAKSLPFIGGLVVALLLGQNYLGFLFPDPVYDPTEEPQKPQVQPLSEVQDRVLFTVSPAESNPELTGPWRTGTLDVYDGEFWRLPPFAAAEIDPVPDNGIVDQDVRRAIEATITIKGLTGAVLPALPNTAGIAFRGPELGYDARNGNVRLLGGDVPGNFEYTLFSGPTPTVEELRDLQIEGLPESFDTFLDIPDIPPAVQGLIDQAPTDSKWEQWNFLRLWILDNVVASGSGQPVEVTPERVADMIGGSQKGTPFELVAAQAMLARWVGIPSRIGYGFDGGERANNVLEVRPRHGAAFPEVFFPGFKWVPVIGTPRQAEPSVGSDPENQNQQAGIQPSDELSVPIYLPFVVEPDSTLPQQIGLTVAVLLLIALVLYILYVLYPAFVKARLRRRRRNVALDAGVRERVALSYSEWRDYATDLGFLFPTDTPLGFLDRFNPDEEHTELAWLTTRVLWGDLQDDPPVECAAIAEELSRSLRRRLAATQPATGRAVAAVSRLSIRNPYVSDDEEVDDPIGRLSRLRRNRAATSPESEPDDRVGADEAPTPRRFGRRKARATREDSSTDLDTESPKEDADALV